MRRRYHYGALGFGSLLPRAIPMQRARAHGEGTQPAVPPREPYTAPLPRAPGPRRPRSSPRSPAERRRAERHFPTRSAGGSAPRRRGGRGGAGRGPYKRRAPPRSDRAALCTGGRDGSGAESCEGGERGGEAGPERSAAGPLALPRRKEGWGGPLGARRRGREGRRGQRATARGESGVSPRAADSRESAPLLRRPARISFPLQLRGCRAAVGAIRGRSFGASEEFPCPSRCACGQGAELGGAPCLAAPLSRARGARGRPGSSRSGAGQCPSGPNRAAAARSPAVPGAAVPLLGERLGAVLVAEGFLKYRATEECGRRMRGRCGLGAKGWANPC